MTTAKKGVIRELPYKEHTQTHTNTHTAAKATASQFAVNNYDPYAGLGRVSIGFVLNKRFGFLVCACFDRV